MQADQARLRRLRRLERVRAIAKHDALRAAASAEHSLARLLGLARRTADLAGGYRTRTAIEDGSALARHHAFLSGITGIEAATSGDAAEARALADRRQEELALAERRRAAVEDRARDAQRTLELRHLTPMLGSRRAVGTPLE